MNPIHIVERLIEVPGMLICCKIIMNPSQRDGTVSWSLVWHKCVPSFTPNTIDGSQAPSGVNAEYRDTN